MQFVNALKNKLLIVFVLIAPLNLFGQIQKDSIPQNPYFVASVSDLRKQIDESLKDPNLANSFIGISIRSLKTGEILYRRNDDRLFVPASSLKLLTTSAALKILGAEYRYATEIYTRGTLDGSTLDGDLIIRGFGDPTISGRFQEQDILHIFSQWADSLLAHGIDEIRGDIIGDDNAFDDLGLGEGWEWDYETNWFAAQSGALSFNDNCVDILIEPSFIGEPALIEIIPDSKYVVITNSVYTVDSDSVNSIKVNRDRGTNYVSISGSITENSPTIKTYSTVNNPTQFFLVVLKSVFEEKGIKVTGYGVDIDDLGEFVSYDEANFLFSHFSPPLKDIIRVTNKNSLNFYAEQILKTLGYEVQGFGSADKGVEVIRTLADKWRIDASGISQVDGSGLSRLNLISPAAMSQILRSVYQSENFTYLFNSLPIAGVDGTLATRMRKGRAYNNVRAKTGFLRGARSLAGYLYTGDNELVAFSIIVNNFSSPVGLADRIQDSICELLANYKRK